MVQRLPVVQVLDLVDPHQPVLRGERLLQVLELDVLVADLGVARAVEARRRPEVQLQRRGSGEGDASALKSKRSSVFEVKERTRLISKSNLNYSVVFLTIKPVFETSLP